MFLRPDRRNRGGRRLRLKGKLRTDYVHLAAPEKKKKDLSKAPGHDVFLRKKG